MSVYNSIKHAIANGIGKKDSEDAIGAKSVNAEDDLRATRDILVAMLALVCGLAMCYRSDLGSFLFVASSAVKLLQL